MPRQTQRKVTHVHKLKRHIYPKTGNAIYFCTLPDCHHKIDVPLALGKNTICNYCGDEFTITENTLKLKLPHCDKCGKVRVKNEDGSYRLAKKVQNHILDSVPLASASELLSRLNSITTVADEEDI